MEVEAAGLGVVVAVLFDGQAGVFGQRDVIAPGRRRHPQLLVAGEEGRQERSADTQRTRSRDALHRRVLNKIRIK